MKRYQLTIAITLALLVFAGCSDGFMDIFTPPNTTSPNNGSLNLSLRMGGEGRTVLPTITINRYDIAFTAVGKDTVNITTNKTNMDISIATGTWKCEVSGFIDGLEKPLVSGTANVTVSTGRTNAVSVSLTFIPITGEEGEGKFAYDITLPANLRKAELSIASLTNNDYIEKINLLDNNKGTLSDVTAGYYMATIDLCHENYTTAVKIEVIHIYKNQTTSMTVDFTKINFASAPAPIQSYKIVESGSVVLEDLTANQVFAVVVNKGTGYANYSYTGGVTSYTLNGENHQVALAGRSASRALFDTSDRNVSLAEEGDNIPLQYDKSKASEFNSNPLPIPSVSKNSRSARTASFISPNIGDKRLFWLDDSDRTSTWQEKQATLTAISNRAEIWIMDEYFDNGSAGATDNKLTSLQAKALAEKFDAIYQYTTPIFGYEYGGGPNSPQPGGVDGNPRIVILVYDIDANSSSGGTVGYFWSKDHYNNEYLQSQKYDYKSNLAEIFYVDSYWADAHPETVYSTLIHEFVHMINFNEKYVVHNKSYGTWYTEMLAMLGEDAIGPLVGIGPNNSGHPIMTRIPYTLGLYSSEPTYWYGFMSYGITYGFGAYLARNFGGTALIREIAQNEKTNIDSISLALSVLNPSIDFTKAVERYHEAFICNDTRDRGMASFNKTITNTINGYQYVLHGFDIYKINRVNVALSPSVISYWTSNEKGSFLYGLSQNYVLDYYSFILLSCADWQNVSGDMIVDVKKPTSASVNMYLIVK
jgi:hypothetical protein